MKPIDFRNETFHQLQERLTDLRQLVLSAWITQGPGTTRQVAQAAGIDLLTFRPRTTELFQIGAVALVEGDAPGAAGDGHGHEGVYRARTVEEWEAWHRAQAQAMGISGQQQLMS
jgi:hypothetical protein